MNRSFLVGAICALAFSDPTTIPFRHADRVPFQKGQRERQAARRLRNQARKVLSKARKARKEEFCEV
jgi:hypothetical protein